MFTKDIGIDLGTVNILIYIKGEGVVISEPSIIVIDEEKQKVLACGLEAYEMLGRTPGKLKVIKPMKDGVIADFDSLYVLLEYLLKKVKIKNKIFKPRIVICCPSNITEVEKNAIIEAAYKAGAKKVYLEEEPKVAALGAGLDISKPKANMIVDIGGGTTDIAIISLGNIVSSASIKVAGNTFDTDIINYVKEKYKLLIGEKTAENIKVTIGTIKNQKNQEMKVKGRDLVGGLPKTITLTSAEIEIVLKDGIQKIVKVIKTVLESTPPELSSDIVESGMVLTGGGALLDGLSSYLEEQLKVPVFVADQPLKCVAEGTGLLLSKLEYLN